MKDSVKQSLKHYSFIKKFGLEFHDYEVLTKGDYDLIQKWHDINENLERVIKALEWSQNEEYSSLITLALSYLYDIQNNEVPENLITDKDKKK